MKLDEVKFDCLYFKGTIPCKYNKTEGKTCPSCDRYQKISKTILIIKLGAIGDVIRTTPLIIKYNELFPNCHFTWITDFPDILPKGNIHEILKFDFKSVMKIEYRKFDIAINLDKDYEACSLIKRINAKDKFGFTFENDHLSGCTPAADHKLLTGFFDELSIRNTKSYPDEIFEICHLNYNKEPYLISTDNAMTNKWITSLKEKAEGKKIIAINTGCGVRWLTRLWPDEYYEQLINTLIVKGYYPILLGGPEEDAKNKDLSIKTGGYYPGTFSLKEFISILSATDVVFSLVTMAMHITIALKKPLILLNNIFNKYEFELFGRGEILEPESGCDCYFGTECKRRIHCMNDLSVESVLDAIERQL
ncbi:MAG: glycosyltransferase family 9 protein [Bacteroidales bacterium]|nr:glycosyltransferase family 9 protein [Bacteroidales bacterium]